MASGRKFGWKNAGAAIGGGLAGAGLMVGLGKLGAPPVITSSILGGMALVGVGVTRGPVQTAIASTIGGSSVVLISSALKAGREHGERKREETQPKGKPAPAERVADKGKGSKPRDSAMESAALEAFDQMRASLAIDAEERAAL